MPLKFANNQSLTSTTALPSAVPTDNLILISTQTASNSSSVSFTSGINSTYDMYEVHFINIASTPDVRQLLFDASTDGGSSYGIIKTTTYITAYHDEADTTTDFSYNTSADLAQSTSAMNLFRGNFGDSDAASSGYLQLFNPSSTTYVKHFMSGFSESQNSPGANNIFTAGYFNTTSAINAIRFTFNTGNIVSGIFKLYGVKKS